MSVIFWRDWTLGSQWEWGRDSREALVSSFGVMEEQLAEEFDVVVLGTGITQSVVAG